MSNQLDRAVKQYWKLQNIITYTTLPMFVVVGYVAIFGMLLPAFNENDFASHFFSGLSVAAAGLVASALSIFITILTVYYIPKNFSCKNCHHELGAHERQSGVRYNHCSGKKGLKFEDCVCMEFKFKEKLK